MSMKVNKNGKEYDLGFVPQSLYDDVEELKEAVDEIKHSLMKTEVKSFTFDGNGVSWINEKYINVIPEGEYIIARVSSNYMKAYVLPNATLAINVTISATCTYISQS